MKYFTVVFGALVVLTFSGKTSGVDYEFRDDEEYEDSNVRDGKIFTFLAVEKLPDVACGSGASQGICRKQHQCIRHNGTVLSGATCGGGYDICCEFRTTCSGNNNNGKGITVSTSGVHIRNPSGTTSSCRINLKRPSSDVCQVRLDFVDFNSVGPNDEGDCIQDFMTITGAQNLRGFTTCGNNSGQHLYLDYGPETDTITVSITLTQLASMYDIVVTYITCEEETTCRSGRKLFKKKFIKTSTSCTDPVERAPPGCAQYYTNTSGEIRSFNYAPEGAVATQNQINNQRYSICFKAPSGASTITFTPCDGESFCISTTPDMPGQSGDNCTTDWIDFPGCTPYTRYCGCNFTSTITCPIQPWIVYVNFNEFELPGLNDPVDPRTGCPVGFTCLDDFGAPAPTDMAYCNGSNNGFVCSPDDYYTSITDVFNYGFCLRYRIQ